MLTAKNGVAAIPLAGIARLLWSGYMDVCLDKFHPAVPCAKTPRVRSVRLCATKVARKTRLSWMSALGDGERRQWVGEAANRARPFAA